MKFYENIEFERDRIQGCINKYGWTSDHHLDWWICGTVSEDGIPVFVEWPDGSGLLTHRYEYQWRIWSDPLSSKSDAPKKIVDFSEKIFRDHEIKEIWCDDVSDSIYLKLKNSTGFKLEDVFYFLEWPILDMFDYDPSLSGGHFKEMRNARNKFYKEHDVKVVKASEVSKSELHKIVDDWKKSCSEKDLEYVQDLKYRRLIDNNFKGFNSVRVLVVGGRPVGINAGYEVVNCPGRFAGIVGIHDYSMKDLGEMLWIEDFDWVKNAGYKEFDLQGSEDNGGLKLKLRFGGKIERKTDTFCIKK